MNRLSKKYVNEEDDLDIDTDDNENIKVIGNDIYFYSDINTQSILDLTIIIKNLTNKLLINQIQYNLDFEQNINLHIKSDGGDVFAGLSILKLIQDNKIDIYSYIEGSVCSAATLIALICKKRYITEHSYMLIHNISSDFWGKMHEIEDEMKNLTSLTKNLKKIYTKHSSITLKQLDSLLKKDLLLDAKTCKRFGFIDEII